MGQDVLNKVVLCRFKELGLPPSLMEIDEFRENFCFRGWVMFVRDGDQVVDVHLVQPQQGIKLSRCGAVNPSQGWKKR